MGLGSKLARSGVATGAMPALAGGRAGVRGCAVATNSFTNAGSPLRLGIVCLMSNTRDDERCR